MVLRNRFVHLRQLVFFEVSLHDFYQLVERGRVVNRDFGHRFAVEHDRRQLQAVDEFAVAQAAHPAGGVDANNPEAAERTLLGATVAEREGACPDERRDRLAI